MKDDWSQEYNGGVKVQDCRDDRFKAEQRGEKRDRAATDPFDAGADCCEQSVRLDDSSDQEQAGNQNERRPSLLSGLTDRLAHVNRFYRSRKGRGARRAGAA